MYVLCLFYILAYGKYFVCLIKFHHEKFSKFFIHNSSIYTVYNNKYFCCANYCGVINKTCELCIGELRINWKAFSRLHNWHGSKKIINTLMINRC